MVLSKALLLTNMLRIKYIPTNRTIHFSKNILIRNIQLIHYTTNTKSICEIGDKNIIRKTLLQSYTLVTLSLGLIH